MTRERLKAGDVVQVDATRGPVAYERTGGQKGTVSRVDSHGFAVIQFADGFNTSVHVDLLKRARS